MGKRDCLGFKPYHSMCETDVWLPMELIHFTLLTTEAQWILKSPESSIPHIQQNAKKKKKQWKVLLLLLLLLQDNDMVNNTHSMAFFMQKFYCFLTGHVKDLTTISIVFHKLKVKLKVKKSGKQLHSNREYILGLLISLSHRLQAVYAQPRTKCDNFIYISLNIYGPQNRPAK